jgi:pimeloyl-ACP methyl ester carboxylesterase
LTEESTDRQGRRPDHEVKIDGRRLAVDVCGAPDGRPVFLLHGTPGSRRGPRPRGIVLQRLGIKLISYDRPGYGDSDRRENRTVVDAATDVAAIADFLDVDQFSVAGRSGGGPHALACAAQLGDRVARAAVLVSLAPADASDWYRGMTDANVEIYRSMESDLVDVLAHLRTRVEHAHVDPESMFTFLRPSMAAPDHRVVDDIAIRRLFIETYEEAFRAGPDGWIDDLLAFRRGWGFDVSAIKAPVRLWHGEDDTFAPVSHTRWLGDRIPGAEVVVEPGTAHFGAVEVLPTTLAWLATPLTQPAPRKSERMWVEYPVDEQPLAQCQDGGMPGADPFGQPIGDFIGIRAIQTEPA